MSIQHENKRQVALRLNTQLIERMDKIRPETRFHTRTDLIEEACAVYIEYIQDCLERA